MTKNQKKLLAFIARYRERYLDSPTLREMVAGTGVFDNRSVLGILEALEKDGYVTKRRDRRSRGVRLTQKAHEVLGLVPAESPAEPPDALRRLRRHVPNFVSFTETTSGRSPLVVNGTAVTPGDEPRYLAALLLSRFRSGTHISDPAAPPQWWMQAIGLLRESKVGWVTVSAIATFWVVVKLVGKGADGAAWFLLILCATILAATFVKDHV